MNIKNVCVLGGGGFVGRHIAYRLAGEGYRCRVFTRHAHRHRSLAMSTGCELVEVNIFDAGALARALRDCDAVIHLVGILNESGRQQTFRRIHVDLVDTVVRACHETGVRRLLHMSALQADQAIGSSQYLRSKGEGENRAHTLGQPDIAVTSFRPSVIFGPDDSFLNRFAALLKIPGPLPLACAGARFAPVYVQDVVEAMANALPDPTTFGRRYVLCGPDEFTLQEIVRLVALHTGRNKPIVRLPDWLSRLQARLLQFVPGRPFTPDNYDSLRTASVCKENGLERLGVVPTPLRDSAARMLGGANKAAWLNGLREHAGR